jgi:hypothetical protein
LIHRPSGIPLRFFGSVCLIFGGSSLSSQLILNPSGSAVAQTAGRTRRSHYRRQK